MPHKGSMRARPAGWGITLVTLAMLVGPLQSSTNADNLTRSSETFPRGMPHQYAKTSGGQNSGSTCPLPPTDLCTDYSLFSRRWQSMPYRFAVNEHGAPAGFATDIVDAAMVWELELKSAQVEAAYPGDRSTIDVEYAGTTTAVPGTRDGVSAVGFVAGICRGCWARLVSWHSGGRLIEADVLFEANYVQEFMTDVTCPTLDCPKGDIQGIAVHEFGHVFGHGHVTAEADLELVMFNGIPRGSTKNRDLGAGDVLGARVWYPTSG